MVIQGQAGVPIHRQAYCPVLPIPLAVLQCANQQSAGDLSILALVAARLARGFAASPDEETRLISHLPASCLPPALGPVDDAERHRPIDERPMCSLRITAANCSATTWVEALRETDHGDQRRHGLPLPSLYGREDIFNLSRSDKPIEPTTKDHLLTALRAIILNAG